MRRDRTVTGLTVALPLVALFGMISADWLRFLLQSSLAGTLVVLGVLLQMRAGLVSFGQGLFYCLGAYAAGMAAYFLGWTDAFLLLFLGVAVSVLAAFIFGFLLARYREIFFAMLTMALSMILYGLLVKAQALGSTDGFNVPSATFMGWAPTGRTHELATFIFTTVVAYLSAVGLTLYISSPYGHAGDSIRLNEIRVEYLGASVRRLIHIKYVIAAALSGAGGVITAISMGHIGPELAFWTTSGEFVFIALLSGTGSVAAPFMGAFLLELIRTYAFEHAPYTWQMILGGTMLAVIMFLPGGLWSLAGARRTGE